jgi:probable HAF family extracellular repeat protein
MNIPNTRKKRVINKQTFQALPLINTKSLVLMLILGPVASLSSYAANLIDLGQNVRPQDINDLGTVVGARDTNQYPTVAFRWTASTGFENLDGTIANAINDYNKITGNTLTGAFFFDGNTSSYIGDEYKGEDINSDGQIAGSKSKPNPFRATPRPVDPAIYDSNINAQTWTVLDVANVYSRGTRKGVYADIYVSSSLNDAGYMVGKKSRYGLSGSSAFITTPAFNSVSFLPIPNGGYATAINNSNYIVGAAPNLIPGEYTKAFLYDYSSSTRTDLGTLPVNGPGSESGLTSYAVDINDLNQVVGNSWLVTALTSLPLPEKYHAFIWENGQMTDLNNLIPTGTGWILTHATAISENSVIVGFGLKDGMEHGFILDLNSLPPSQIEQPPVSDPLPEPTTPVEEPIPAPAPEPIPTTPSSDFPAIDRSAEPIEAEGTVTEAGINYFVVKDSFIWFDDSATIKFKSGYGDTIDVGEKVQVKAHANIDGSGTAIKIKVGG